jgi:glycosyltransferase involved in cell wall biosynthesis
MQVKKNIVFVSNSGSIGGAQRCLLDLIYQLPINLKPIVIIPRKGKFELELINNEIEYKIINFRGWWYSKFRIKLLERLINNFFCLFKAFQYLKNKNVSLVYTNTLYSPFGAILAYRLKVPHIWHIHEFTHLNYIQKFDFGIKNSLNFVNSFSNEIICPSNILKSDILNFVNPNKIFVINNGTEITYNISQNTPKQHHNQTLKLIMIGSVINFKGHYDAILLLNKLILNNIDTTLFIVGDGDKRFIKELKNFANNLGVKDLIVWTGFKENVINEINKADILLVCSKHETFGMTILEAMSNHCPVISTKNGGAEEIIVDGYNGYLYESGNIEMLYKCTLNLLDEKNYNQIRINAYSIIKEKFNKTYNAKKIIQRINDLI